MRDGYRVFIIMLVSCISLFVVYYIAQYFGSQQVVFFLKNNARYFWYLLGTGVLLYPLLHSSGKREKYILGPMVISHIVIVFIFFATTQFGMKTPLAILTVLSFVGLFLSISIHHWARIFLIFPMTICIVASVIITVTPKYETIPTEQDFYDSIGINLYVIVSDIPMTLRDVTADIKIESSFTGQQVIVAIDEASKKIRKYPIKRPGTIHFNASKILYNTFAFVQFYDGRVLAIPAQSSVEIQYTQSGYITYATGNDIEKTVDNAAGFIADQTARFMQDYTDQRRSFFINRVGGPWTQNIYVDRSIGYILDTLYNIAPSYYTNNYANYKKFKILLGEKMQEESRNALFQESNTSIWENILPGIQRSRIFRGLVND